MSTYVLANIIVLKITGVNKLFNIKFYLLLVLICCSSIVCAKQNPVKSLGDNVQILIPITGYVATFFLDDQEGRNQFYKAFVTNLGITYALKIGIDAPRPDGRGGHAFPSGHTSVAFQGAAFIHRRYGWQCAILPYIGATFVGMTRIDLGGEPDYHSEEDVVAGAALGVASSFYFTNRFQSLNIRPVIQPHFSGINFQFRW